MRNFEMPGRSTVYADNGICATSHPLAAKVALDMLQNGGNAVDAAIAGAVLLGICEPQMTGLAGDCFILLKPADSQQILALNGSGRAPAALDAQTLRQRGLTSVPLRGTESITLPGAVDAFCRLSTDHGRLELAQALAPAIHYADTGIPVAPRVARDWAADAPALQGRARDLYLSQGQPFATGARFRAPGQAQVLRAIATHGRDGFYKGPVADDLIDSLRALGGVHSHDDLDATRADWNTPIQGPYKGATLWEHAPNGQGATAILLLNILSHFDLSALDPLGPARAHLEAEATKLAYDARNRLLADPDHTTRLAHMLAPETAAKLAALIDPKRAMSDVAPLTEAIHRDTVYITVVDRDRMAVSLIYSVFWGFGAGLASNRYGLLFQNRGAGFSLTPGHPNELKGGKRPMHTIIPAMLDEGLGVNLPFGVMGGGYQPCGHARFASNLRDFGMDLQSAIDAPRSFATPDGLKVESGYSAQTRQALADLGHHVIKPEEPLGGAQAIRIRPDGVLEGASDPRKDGIALGY